MLGLIVPKTKKNIAQSKERESLKNILSKISSYYEKNLKSSDLPIKYLKSRGIDGKTAKHYALGYAHNSWDDILNNFGRSEEEKKQLLDCGLLIKKDAGGYYDRFRNRIMFPIRNNKGEIVGFACILDRSNGKSKIDKKIVSQIEIEIPIFKKDDLPKHLKNLKAVKPGSRNI